MLRDLFVTSDSDSDSSSSESDCESIRSSDSKTLKSAQSESASASILPKPRKHKSASDNSMLSSASTVQVSPSLSLRLRVAADDARVSAEARRCLFAGHIWSGSRSLASFLASQESIVRGKSVVEVGCGAALPGLAAAALGAREVVLSDYPSEALQKVVETNVNENKRKGNLPQEVSVEARGLAWGEEVPEDLQGRFDVVIASECIWNHAQHEALLFTIHELLVKHDQSADEQDDHKVDQNRSQEQDQNPTEVIVTFAHHVKGCEAEDLAFFDKARSLYGFEHQQVATFMVPQMWSPEKTTELFLVRLWRPAKRHS